MLCVIVLYQNQWPALAAKKNVVCVQVANYLMILHCDFVCFCRPLRMGHIVLQLNHSYNISCSRSPTSPALGFFCTSMFSLMKSHLH